jgi:hypothetical protein
MNRHQPRCGQQLVARALVRESHAHKMDCGRLALFWRTVVGAPCIVTSTTLVPTRSDQSLNSRAHNAKWAGAAPQTKGRPIQRFRRQTAPPPSRTRDHNVGRRAEMIVVVRKDKVCMYSPCGNSTIGNTVTEFLFVPASNNGRYSTALFTVRPQQDCYGRCAAPDRGFFAAMAIRHYTSS